MARCAFSYTHPYIIYIPAQRATAKEVLINFLIRPSMQPPFFAECSQGMQITGNLYKVLCFF